MGKYFPLSGLPPRQFNLGDRVENHSRDSVVEAEYISEGTVFGYQFQHPAWLFGGDLLVRDSGWVYCVVWNYEQGEEQAPIHPCIDHTHEDNLTLIEGTEHAELKLTPSVIEALFGDYPELCLALVRHSQTFVVTVSTASEVTENTWIEIVCSDYQTYAYLQQREPMLISVLKASHFSTRVVLRFEGRSVTLSETPSPRLIISSSTSIPLVMPESSLILSPRALRHQALLQAISRDAVCVTLHDANESSGFAYLDVQTLIADRLNKPKELILNQPASIVDPRIAEPRIHHIKKAIASGQCERYSYTYEDSHIWHFDVTVAPIYGTEEIITIVSDAASWQLGYWLNRVKVAE